MTPKQLLFETGLSINLVVFGFDGKSLCVLLGRRKQLPYSGLQALPGRLLSAEEDPEDAAQEFLSEILGIEKPYYKQIRAFSDADRHPMGRVLSVGFYALVRMTTADLKETDFTNRAVWLPMHEVPELPFDHNKIIESGYRRLKRRLKHKPVAVEMLDDKFTLPQLQRLYEYLLKKELDKRNFRRKLLKYDLFIPLEEFLEVPNHKPARLYEIDEARYLQLRKEGQNFAP